ncbi:PadR family transcriptional regulator [Halovenus sp. HT40]|uniref:PadR family transcriptional regulator n=1 Tax=Halovenus sp. HT40 TaxID=3126691 RepID=UPI00300EAC28
MTVPLFELTSFQRDILYVTIGIEQPSGQEIKDELEGEQKEITHGRLYPNLDTLVDKGYLDKGMLDRRTNFYSISQKGKQTLQDRYEWERKYVDFD